MVPKRHRVLTTSGSSGDALRSILTPWHPDGQDRSVRRVAHRKCWHGARCRRRCGASARALHLRLVSRSGPKCERRLGDRDPRGIREANLTGVRIRPILRILSENESPELCEDASANTGWDPILPPASGSAARSLSTLGRLEHAYRALGFSSLPSAELTRPNPDRKRALRKWASLVTQHR